MTNEFVYNFICKNKYAVLSTATKDGKPEAALVGIAVTKDLQIIFDTVSTSRKYHNLINNPLIALVIGWENEQTMQYEGVARIPNENEIDSLLNDYFTIFPDGIERKNNWKTLVYFCVEPTWIRYSDFNSPQTIEEKVF